MRIALAQTNTTVGDLDGNAQRILSFARRAAESGADVVAFPELTLTGYPPRYLLEKQNFLDQTEQHLERLASDTAHLKIAIICGTVTRTGSSSGNPIYNSAAVLERGKIVPSSAAPSPVLDPLPVIQSTTPPPFWNVEKSFFGRTKCCCRATTSSMSPAISNRLPNSFR